MRPLRSAALTIALGGFVFSSACVCAWFHHGGLAFFALLWVAGAADRVRFALEESRLAAPLPPGRSVELVAVREEEVERSPCDHDFDDGACVLCGASSRFA